MQRLLFALAALMLSTPVLAVGSLADVQIYDRAAGRNLPVHWGPVHWSEPTAYVAGAPGSEYALRIRNRSAVDVLAVVSVDGVNVVSGESAAPEQGGYVIPAHGSVEIKGWRKSLDRIAAFYFTDLGDSYAARTGRPDNVGVIGVALFKRKPPEAWLQERDYRSERQESPAFDAARGPASGSGAPPSRAARKAAPAPSLGTGHGRGETSHARYVEFERESSAPNEVVKIRYDSRHNLIALGVIRTPRSQPDPFPAAFVPDPPARW